MFLEYLGTGTYPVQIILPLASDATFLYDISIVSGRATGDWAILMLDSCYCHLSLVLGAIVVLSSTLLTFYYYSTITTIIILITIMIFISTLSIIVIIIVVQDIIILQSSMIESNKANSLPSRKLHSNIGS